MYTLLITDVKMFVIVFPIDAHMLFSAIFMDEHIPTNVMWRDIRRKPPVILSGILMDPINGNVPASNILEEVNLSTVSANADT